MAGTKQHEGAAMIDNHFLAHLAELIRAEPRSRAELMQRFTVTEPTIEAYMTRLRNAGYSVGYLTYPDGEKRYRIYSESNRR